jgi:spore coat polysaccharide biosynthesis predicted glycosyltransferase SpsG
MGHFFRALNLHRYLDSQGERSVILLNEHAPAVALLREKAIPFEVVDLLAEEPWEGRLISRLGITVWVNDRLDTDLRHAERVKQAGALLVTVDDRGSGAQAADLHFAPLIFERTDALGGRKVLHGPNYLVLDAEIARYRRQRTRADRIVVSLGGSDTYGVTLKVLAVLQGLGRPATIHVGPAFDHHAELAKLVTPRYPLLERPASLAQAFGDFDLAITGGGVTPFEANAAGLPCIVVANEAFEVPVGRFLAAQGGCLFAGHHNAIDEMTFAQPLDIPAMSRAGMERITLDGAANVYREIRAL